MGTPYVIRPVRLSDAAGVNAIQTHYISHTNKTIYYKPFSVKATEEKILDAQSSNYTFLVAVSEPGPDDADIEKSDQGGQANQGDVLAYACLAPFRPQEGWTPTAELSLFVHPNYTRNGLGKTLLDELVGAMRRSEPSFQKSKPRPNVRSVVAVVVVDEDDLEGWYGGFGFQRVGFFKEGGEKGGVKLDIAMLRLVL